MKRSVAIFGPTPPWVRWAIIHSCPLRQAVDEPLDSKSGKPIRVADRVFRHLRGLRAFGDARVEKRIRQGVCLHRQTIDFVARFTSTDAAQDAESLVAHAWGFFADEVVGPFGGAAFVDGCCGSCPANTHEVTDAIAGCYGSLAAIAVSKSEGQHDRKRDSGVVDRSCPKPSSQPIEASRLAGRYPLLGLVDRVIERLDLAAELDKAFLPTRPHWFGLWRSQLPSPKQIDLLRRIFIELTCDGGELSEYERQEHIEAESEQAKVSEGGVVEHAVFSKPLEAAKGLLRALELCRQHDLKIHFEAIVPGNSDGQHWELEPTCPNCGCGFDKRAVQRRECPACRRRGGPQQGRKFKVLGMRPYVQLAGIVGKQKTLELIKEPERES